MTVNSEPERFAVELHDRVINHIFGTGLTLAGILSLPGLNDAIAARLRDAIDTLDTAVAELRNAAIARAIEAADALPATPQGVGPADGRRRLCRFSVDEVFAYAINRYDFHRAADNTLWAHESEGLLLSARSGRPLARRDGKVFYDIESALPLYYEDGQAEPPLIAFDARR